MPILFFQGLWYSVTVDLGKINLGMHVFHFFTKMSVNHNRYPCVVERCYSLGAYWWVAQTSCHALVQHSNHLRYPDESDCDWVEICVDRIWFVKCDFVMLHVTVKRNTSVPPSASTFFQYNPVPVYKCEAEGTCLSCNNILCWQMQHIFPQKCWWMGDELHISPSLIVAGHIVWGQMLLLLTQLFLRIQSWKRLACFVGNDVSEGPSKHYVSFLKLL